MEFDLMSILIFSVTKLYLISSDFEPFWYMTCPLFSVKYKEFEGAILDAFKFKKLTSRKIEDKNFIGQSLNFQMYCPYKLYLKCEEQLDIVYG